MKEKVLQFLHSLSIYDYIFFLAVFTVFILLILLIVLIRNKTTLALSVLLIALLEIFLAPTLGFKVFHNLLYGNTITIQKVKRLTFLQALVIEGKLHNDSSFDFKSCKLDAAIYKDTHNRFKNLVFRLKPIKKSTLTLHNIPKGADVTFRFFIEPFTYKKDFNLSINGMCK